MLFQVHFLSLLLEERGAGDLAAVAEHCRQKLIRRHPHVFGDVEAESAGEVLRNWDAIKSDGARPRARDLRRGAREPARAAVRAQGPAPRGLRGPARPGAPDDAPDDRDGAFAEVGDRLFAVVDEARRLRVDPELALRAASQRFRDRIESEEPPA